MPLTLRREPRESGWADAWIGDGETGIGCGVEWEVDTLAELLLEACWDLNGEAEPLHRHRPDRRLALRPDEAGDTERGVLFFTWPDGRVRLEVDRAAHRPPRDPAGPLARLATDLSRGLRPESPSTPVS